MKNLLSKHKATHNTKVLSNGKVVYSCALYISYCKPETSLLIKQSWKVLELGRTVKNEADVYERADSVSNSIAHVHPDPKKV